MTDRDLPDKSVEPEWVSGAELRRQLGSRPEMIAPPMYDGPKLGTVSSEAEAIERLAGFLHEELWAGWALWMIERWYTTTTGEESFQQRWERQAHTAYADLTEQEKESDRIEARKLLSFLWGVKVT